MAFSPQPPPSPFVNGLQYPQNFLSSLKVLLPRPAPHAPIRALTAAQFAQIRHLHLTSDVPDSVLFPFLHGLEGDNLAQNHFFSKNGASVQVPNYRGLIWVVADDEDLFLDGDSDDEALPLGDMDMALDEAAAANSTAATTAAISISTSPASSTDMPNPNRRKSDAESTLSSSTDSIFSHAMSSSALSVSTTATSLHSSASSSSLPSPLSSSPKPYLTSHLLTSTFHPSELLTTNPSGPAFIPPNIPKGISLRNFGIQVPIYATLSDVVVYSPKGLTRGAFALAERFKLAIEHKYSQRLAAREEAALRSSSSPAPPPLPTYNVFIVTSPFSTFESEHPDLISITSKGIATNHVSFPAREMAEMQDLTRASEIIPGVWLGNAADVPIWENGDPEAPFEWKANNPEGYDLCVECHDQAGWPQAALLKQAEEHLAALDTLWATGYAHAGTPTAFASPASSPPRPPPNANTIIHFSFPACPPSTAATLTLLAPFLAFLHTLLHRPRRAKVLIYSHDGYTESSVLALSVLMSERRCSLPEAYLELQVGRGRSFFVQAWDLGVLRRIEGRYYAGGGAARERERAGRERWGWGALMGRSSSSSISSSNNTTTSPALSTSIPSTPITPPEQQLQRRARSQTSPLLPALVDHQSWFNDERFDGSFPSRVLPFLYLGNLNHASNAYMLHALEITHVVSVGECALVPPACGETEKEEYQVVFCAAGNGQNGGVRRKSVGSLWREEKEGRIKVLDIKGVCDDGIDSLRPAFASICDWIEKARLEGGKVLVHCRVGVSRSATVTIAYVMKHLSLSLVDAYLIVRSRRLSVLIQPNMRLLYNLCGWEVELAREKVREEFRQRRAGRSVGEEAAQVQSEKKDTEMDVDSTGTAERDADADADAIAGDQKEEADLMQKALKKSLNWPYLAREVHMLNEKYLH
ncbi:hypothetical protein BU17DRAFT_40942 [Hysterangium stoloniferum]|nr:hypothetical protein BU17DRAFT_40942 [Hysterangium stoloniferum]